MSVVASAIGVDEQNLILKQTSKVTKDESGLIKETVENEELRSFKSF